MKVIPWMKYKFLYFAISAMVILPGMYSLVRYGFNLAVDFTGGSRLALNLPASDQDKLLTIVKKDYPTASLTSSTTGLTLKLPPIDRPQADKLLASLKTQFSDVKEVSFISLGPSVGKDMIRKTLIALALAVLCILSYIAYAFKNVKFGLAAVLAQLHDALVLLGTFSLLGHFVGAPIDLLFVTATLTTLSFSVHDTIVVLDRIRERTRREKLSNFETIANESISQTMRRSVYNSLTIIFMLLFLTLFGGETIHWFALALLIGAITGTYSSPFIAIPLLVIFNTKGRK